MKAKGVIILGSSRSYGNTHTIVSELQQQTGFDLVDLKQYQINHFEYDLKNEDDFNALFKNLTENYETFVFATPIYWYTMSGMMKVFFDRISDFLFEEKEVGRRLRQKTMGVVSCGSDSEIKQGFEMPFVESAAYLGMEYIGHIHTWIEHKKITQEVQQSITNFANQLMRK
ncbi:NAD(P)H-dependent oxidoreductase [Kordia sp. YSTF-M3]|uniref:NAD(P)H-dependent oxidoreductase n=1 Tax=Kordia aestuariivivens TaxID=2759037 RepID=A0ABR7Q6W6_9FLAO|nr:NAD(P)H-dependent oxidoreductase [Kordia aestuariivivens]MBC8754178.1 NAD(P)H-dependent oxidoreductase [Kordia aestuariivivens]